MIVDPSAVPAPAAARMRPDLRSTIWPALFVAVIVLPVVVVTVAASLDGYQPVGDWALIELGVRDVGSNTPLVGPFSRYGWNHPGPLLFWGLALPYVLLGSSSEALLVGAGLWNAAATAGICLIAWRRGAWPLLLLVGAALALVLRGVGAGFLVDPWNPYVTMLPFALLVLSSWAIGCGAHRWAPVAVVSAVFVAQTHVGYAPLVVVLSGWAIVGLLQRLRTHHDQDPEGWPARRGEIVRWLGGSAALGAVLCVPLAVEQVVRSPGNARQILGHFLTGDLPSLGMADAARVVGRHLAVPGIWVSGHEPLDPFVGSLVGGSPWWILPAVGALVVATVVAQRRGADDVARLGVTVGLALAVGILTISRTTDEPFPYLFQWMRPLAMLLWVTVAWAVWVSVPDRLRARAARPAGALLVVVSLLAGSLTLGSSRELIASEGHVDDAVAHLADPVVRAVIDEAGRGPVLLWPAGGCLDWEASGLALELERAGVPVRVFADDAHRYGRHRVADEAEPRATVVVACREGIEEFDERDDFSPVATYSPLGEQGEREFRAAEQALVEDAEARGLGDLLPFIESGALVLFETDEGVDPDLLARWRGLHPDWDARVVVYLGPPLPTAG